jgi:aldehyde dehydrogenase (NAD+)
MRDYLRFYIDGAWSEPAVLKTLDIVNPATEAVCGRIALGSPADVDRAVAAARAAFPGWSATSREERLVVLQRILAQYQARFADLAEALTEEMGAPRALAQQAQVPAGMGHLGIAAKVLQDFVFEERRGRTLIVREAIGVCGLIAPWNWPLNQILCKVAPALATGCTVVLKPSEIAPFTGQILAEIMHAAGVPAGVFNLVQGDGPGVGAPLSRHPDVDMISFTGSTLAGIAVAQAAAPTVKRVAQELGGKSAYIVLDDPDLAMGVAAGVRALMVNCGQSCSAPTRMLVPVGRMDEAVEAARAAAEAVRVGDPTGEATMGPVASEAQWNKVQALIGLGLEEGAELVAGGLGRPDGLGVGYYVKPTVFARVVNDMTIARQEIFGPVMAILAYEDLDHAVAIANDSDYGLAGYVSGSDLVVARAVAARLRAGQISINGVSDLSAPFGGYKMSGNGREWGELGFHDYLETKAVLGFGDA